MAALSGGPRRFLIALGRRPVGPACGTPLQAHLVAPGRGIIRSRRFLTACSVLLCSRRAAARCGPGQDQNVVRIFFVIAAELPFPRWQRRAKLDSGDVRILVAQYTCIHVRPAEIAGDCSNHWHHRVPFTPLATLPALAGASQEINTAVGFWRGYVPTVT
jgi:hypothetical protein